VPGADPPDPARRSPLHRRVPPVRGALPGAGLAVAVVLALAAAVVALTAAPAPPPAPAPAALVPTAPAGAPLTTALTTTADAAPVPPAEVALPTVGVRSRLVDLDVDAAGVLQAPEDPAVAGWYVRGAVPGGPGPAVIAGHVDSRAGPAVFYRLDQLAVGDPVQVTRVDGRVLEYRVATVESYPKAAFPTLRVYGPTPGPELHLITCGGVFDRTSRHYRDNVVVTALPAG
jgi:hypothetical protein